MRLVLGSSSRDRAEILKRLGIPFEVVTADIDEKAIRHPRADTLTRAIALAKAKAVLEKLSGTEPATVITADTVVVFKGRIREKANDAEEARTFLRSYSERIVEVVTSVVVTTSGYSGNWLYATDRAFVHFGAINDAAIENAIARGDVLSSSGALVESDPDLAPYVRAIYGDVDTIIGLSLGLIVPMLNNVGFALF